MLDRGIMKFGKIEVKIFIFGVIFLIASFYIVKSIREKQLLLKIIERLTADSPVFSATVTSNKVVN